MRKGDFIQTYSGVKFYPLDPRVEEVRIEDIAHHLAAVNRFTGATREPYCVAQHSVLVSFNVPEVDALWGLLHDASEAYLNDVARPLKRLPEWSTYRDLERVVMGAICARFGLPATEPKSVGVVDRRMLRTEQRDLMPPPCEGEDRSDAEPYDFPVVPWTAADAETLFLRRFRMLGGRE